MNWDTLLAETLKLSVQQCMALAQAIWDSIAGSPEVLPLSKELKRELKRRLDEMRKNPDAGLPWEVVRAELLAHAGK